MSLDLHIHSTFSDGTLTPTELVTLAKSKKLTAIAITDHDTAEGVAEGVEAGLQMNIQVISGVELSAEHDGMHMHLLGYGFDAQDTDLQSHLHEIQEARDRRNHRIVQKLQDLGVDIQLEEVMAKSPVGQTGRPHIAQVLLEKGVVRSIDDAFKRLLKKGAVAYVPRTVLTAINAIKLIRSAGGVPVLAHPVTIDQSLKILPAVLEQLVPEGLDGIEIYYPIHSVKQKKSMHSLAKRYELVVTGGSDYHGDIRPGTTLAGGKNVHVPDSLLAPLLERSNEHININR